MNKKYFCVFMLVPFALIISLQIISNNVIVKDYKNKQNLVFATEYKIDDNHYIYKKQGIVIGETFIYDVSADMNSIFNEFGAIREKTEQTPLGIFYTANSSKMKKYNCNGSNMQVYKGKTKIVVGFPYIYGSY